MQVADIPYMNLGAADMYPDRDHVFHLEIPKEWKTPDVGRFIGYVLVAELICN